jgi:hypothetical protein
VRTYIYIYIYVSSCRGWSKGENTFDIYLCLSVSLSPPPLSEIFVCRVPGTSLGFRV